MSLWQRGFLAVAAAVFLGTSAQAQTLNRRQQLETELQELQAKVSTLEAQRDAAAADVSATVDAVLGDVQKHTNLMAVTPIGAGGYENGFYLRQGSFELRPGAHIQARYIMDLRKDGKHGDETDSTTGFEIRRARLEFSGSAWDLSYYFQWETNRSGGAVTLLDAYATLPLPEEVYLRAGQYKVWAFHEEDISDKSQLAVEKSLVNSFLGGGVSGRVQGASLIYGNYTRNSDPVYAELLFHDGDTSLDTDFTHAGGKDFGVAARFEFKFSGDWSAYKDFSARNIGSDLLVVGLGGDFSQSDHLNSVLATADAQFKSTAFLSIYGAVLTQYLVPRNTADDTNSFNFGVLVQGAYEISNQWEVFARYDLTHFQHTQATGVKNVSELTAGLTYFMGFKGTAGHKSKLTFDVVWLPKGSPAAVTGSGIQGGTDKSEVVVRAQWNFVI